MNKKLFLSIISLVGLLITGYLTYEHFANKTVSCPIVASNDCETVTMSSYSTIVGIPVALFGLLAWLTIFVSTFFFTHKKTLFIMSIMSGLGVLAAGYFNGIMYFKLNAICIWCEASHALMATTFLLTAPVTLPKKICLISFLLAIPFILTHFF